MSENAFQDDYPDELSHCYGCGRLNMDGLQLKSYWDGDETVARFRPRASHMAIPGYVYNKRAEAVYPIEWLRARLKPAL
jgi:hypothetical protein